MINRLMEKGFFSPLDAVFAQTMGSLSNETDGDVLLAAALVSRNRSLGHLCVDLSRYGGRPVRSEEGEVIEGLKWPEFEPWIKALQNSALVSDYAPLVLDGKQRLYLHRYYAYQERLANRLKAQMGFSCVKVNQTLLEKGLEFHFKEPSQQKEAAKTAVLNRFAVISGGPGTGKTHTVIKILDLILDQAGDKPMNIHLAAPTGKAAFRLEQSVKSAKLAIPCLHEDRIPEQAHTLHRLLRMDWRKPTGFIHNKNNPLSTDLLVVDEASMADAALMCKLLEAIPDTARLILLGDKDQLASVEAGAVLGDICIARQKKMQDCIAHLTHSFRFDASSGLRALSQAVLNNDPDQAIDLLTGNEYQDIGLNEVEDAEALKKELAPLIGRRLSGYPKENNPEKRMEILQSFGLLCAHKEGPFGVRTLNLLVEEFLGFDSKSPCYNGRPVMIRRNEPRLNLFNGDIGVVCNEAQVYFPGRETLQYSRLPELETVFAMTVHKSQGSEFKDLVVILPNKRSPVLNRNLLYTAVTRASGQLTILGSPDIIREAIKKPTDRTSGLSDLL